MSQAERRYDRLSVRLSLIISRLLAGETLNMRKLAAEFGVSERNRFCTAHSSLRDVSRGNLHTRRTFHPHSVTPGFFTGVTSFSCFSFTTR